MVLVQDKADKKKPDFFNILYYTTGAISPSDYARHSTRSKKVTNYNEDNSELWGISDEEMTESYTPAAAEEEEGEVIEAVLDHRRRDGYGKYGAKVLKMAIFV